ncbi:hypothetical protein Bca4012_075705 [Brassica carinata]
MATAALLRGSPGFVDRCFPFFSVQSPLFPQPRCHRFLSSSRVGSSSSFHLSLKVTVFLAGRLTVVGSIVGD